MSDKGIHKAAGLIVRDRKLLISRNKGKDFFINVGGKLEPGETSEQALVRELMEEQGITTHAENLELLDTYHAIAAGFEAEQLQLTMDVFFVRSYEGEPSPQAEIAENLWFESSMLGTVNLASILEHEVVPELRRRNLID